MLYDARSLHNIFDKVDEYIRKYDSTKYLALFHSNIKCGRILYRIRYLLC